MVAISDAYVEQLPDIYKDVLRTFALLNPPQRLADGAAVQSLWSNLHDKYTLAQVRVACEKMADAGVVTLKNEIFVHVTPTGLRLVELLTGYDEQQLGVPDFPPLDVQHQEA